MQFNTKPYHINETIFREGSSGSAAYILKEGCVEISIKTDDKKTVLAILKPVSVFGEMALLLKDHKRIATATAMEYSELVEISRDNFDKFIESSLPFIKTILCALAERLQHANAKLMRVPDIFVATCEILNVLFEHGNTDINFDVVLSAIANALSIDQKIIRGQLFQLEKLRLIEIKNKTGGQMKICSLKAHFLQQAMKIHEVQINFGEETGS